MKFAPLLLCISLLPAAYCLSQAQHTTCLGVLEAKPNHSAYHLRRGDSLIHAIRPMFLKEEHKWISLMDPALTAGQYPKEQDWAITFDGNTIGHTRSTMAPLPHPDCTWCFPRDAWHQPASTDLPLRMTDSLRFASWAIESNVYRPLVVTSTGDGTDPQHWKKYLPTADELASLIPAIRRDYHLSFEEVTRLSCTEGFRSANGDMLLAVHCACERFESEFPLYYYVRRDHSCINLSVRINDRFSHDDFSDDDTSFITLVDAGDYDQDGQSEWLFYTSRYNGDGYVLFYHQGEAMAEFVWSYH